MTETPERQARITLLSQNFSGKALFSVEGVRNEVRLREEPSGEAGGRCQEHKMLRVGPLSRVVLLPSVCPLPGQCLLPLQPAPITNLTKHLPQAPCWVTSVLSHPLRPCGVWKFTRKEYWSGSPRPAGDLPDPGMEPESPALADGFFTKRVSWDAHPSPPGAYCNQRGAEEPLVPLLVSLVTNAPSWRQSLCNWRSLPLPSRHCCCVATHRGIAPGPCFQHVSVPIR